MTSEVELSRNLTIILLRSRSSELNLAKNLWQYLRQNWLSNAVFEDNGAIPDTAWDT